MCVCVCVCVCVLSRVCNTLALLFAGLIFHKMAVEQVILWVLFHKWLLVAVPSEQQYLNIHVITYFMNALSFSKFTKYFDNLVEAHCYGIGRTG